MSISMKGKDLEFWIGLMFEGVVSDFSLFKRKSAEDASFEFDDGSLSCDKVGSDRIETIFCSFDSDIVGGGFDFVILEHELSIQWFFSVIVFIRKFIVTDIHLGAVMIVIW